VALKPGQVYAVMRAAYRQGVLDQFIPIFGEALDAAMQEADINLNDLFNKMDDAGQETVDKVDRAFVGSGPLLRLAASDRIMKLSSRLLDYRRVRRIAVHGMERFLISRMDAERAESAPGDGNARRHLASLRGKFFKPKVKASS
jgi:hypothetical protein